MGGPGSGRKKGSGSKSGSASRTTKLRAGLKAQASTNKVLAKEWAKRKAGKK